MHRWLALALLLGGCASAFPKEVMSTVNPALTVEVLRTDPLAFKGQRAMVGGEILSTQPQAGQTEIELLARRLGSDGAPERGDQSPGRVLLRSPEFLDPAVYGQGRRITVIGTVSGVEERKVGDVPYRYPVILAERIRLWPKDVVLEPGYYPGGGWPYYYDPYYFWPRRGFYPYGWWW
ncbi:MAG TPA: Slp family lipoprotein [Methylomirabilota bacterium]|jgi:outer membrane lipoprotein